MTKKGAVRFGLSESELAAEHFRREGYAVIRGVWTASEIAAAHAATDELKRRALEVGSAFRHGNLQGWLAEDASIGLNVIGMQWPGHWSPLLERMRRDPRMLEILRPLIGENIRQIIHQLHWKTPGASFSVSFHRDRRSRKPAEAYRDLENSYVQIGTAIDPMTPENGALLVVPGSHLDGRPLEIKSETAFKSGTLGRSVLYHSGYREEDILPIYAEPGDVVFWHVDTIHGSDENQSKDLDRCLFINGYVKAQNCMRGQWAFIKGEGIPLPPVDVPVLIQREEIFDHLSFETNCPMTRAQD